MPTRRLTRILANTSLVIVSMAVALGIAEYATRTVYADRVKTLVDVDHRMKPNRSDTNRDGIRSTVDPDDLRAEDTNVIILGDSFAYGSGSKAERALPQRLEAMARAAMPGKSVNVLNFGWTSSSPYLSLRLLRDIGSRYKPDAVMLLVDGTDFYDDLAHRKYIEARGLYSLVEYLPGTFYLLRTGARRWLSDRQSEWVLGLPSNRFYAYDAPLDTTRPYFWAITDSINEIARYVRETLGARFYLILSARHFQYSDRESPKNHENNSYTQLGPYVLEPNRYFDEQFGHREFPYLSLLPAFQATTVFPTTFEDDPHWTDAGTQVAADAVFAFCLQHGCFE